LIKDSGCLELLQNFGIQTSAGIKYGGTGITDAISMDLRELVRSHPEMVVGHKSISDTLNVRKESQRFGKDPLESLIHTIGDEDAVFMKRDIGRYLQAYSWYSLCLKRCFQHISVARRSYAELRYHPKNEKYSKRKKQIAAKRNATGPYLEMDYQNLIIHACILLDRTIGISRRFFAGGSLPSFTSFNKHVAFLSNNAGALGQPHKKYQEKLSSCAEWYNIPLKVLRDKYLMHSSEGHLTYFGWGKSCWDMEMITVIPATLSQKKPLEKVKWICFSPRRLARDIESFLLWFAAYWDKHGS